jgi:hypothetical protein
MKRQMGAISGALMSGLVVLGLVATLVLIGFVSYISAANYGNRAEKQLDAVWVDNQNVLAQYTLKVQEAAQIPEIYKNDLKEVVAAALQGRYGPDGSKGVFQWLKEANIPFDNAVYTKMMQIIEAGRNDFQKEQTRLIDVKRSYETELGYVWRGFWLRQAGYPTLDLAKYKPVLAADTARAFELGQQAPLQLRSK